MVLEVQRSQNQPANPSPNPNPNANAPDDADDDVEMLAQSSGHVIYDKLVKTAEIFSSTRIGQFVIERGDRLLKVFEDTAKWGLPQDQTECKLERPLPWLPFLGLIITMRFFRIWLSVGALLIGNEPIMAKHVVSFIQTRRRKLRAIRMHGLKVIRERESERSSSHQETFMEKLGKLFSTAICRPGMHRETDRRISAQRAGMIFSPSVMQSPQRQKRRREDDCPEADLTCDQLLAKYANVNSDDDSDYVPHLDEFDTNDETTTSNENNTTGSDDLHGEYNMEAEKETSKSDENNDLQQQPQADQQQSNKPTALNASVEINQSGGGHHSFPKPISEIKKEPLVEDENVQQPTDNGPSNGAENREADVVRNVNLTTKTSHSNNLNASQVNRGRQQNPINSKSDSDNDNDNSDNENRKYFKDNREKTTSKRPKGITLMKPDVLPSFDTAATARSPPDISSNFKPVSILKNPIMNIQPQQRQRSQLQYGNVHPTHLNENEIILTGTPSDQAATTSGGPNKKHIQPHQHPNRQHYHNRYRGKNRR